MATDIREAAKAHTAICMLNAACRFLEAAQSDGEIEHLDVESINIELRDEIQRQLERYESAVGV